MTTSAATNPAKESSWNGRGGDNWLSAQELTDQLFKPIENAMVKAADCKSPRKVLDIGCGVGGTTRAIAKSLPPDSKVMGIDISRVMIEAAIEQSEQLNSTFVCADAAQHKFQDETFDLLVSRFGIMFFDDPVAAFQNLHQAAARDASALFFAWRSPEENPFMTTAANAASSVISLPPRDYDAPGQFAFSDAERVKTIFEASGWHQIRIETLDFECKFPRSKLVDYFTRLGPLSLVFSDLDPSKQEEVIRVVSEAFAPFVFGEEVRFMAACWQMRMRANESGNE